MSRPSGSWGRIREENDLATNVTGAVLLQCLGRLLQGQGGKRQHAEAAFLDKR
jgi:hypothetical protein